MQHVIVSVIVIVSDVVSVIGLVISIQSLRSARRSLATIQAVHRRREHERAMLQRERDAMAARARMLDQAAKLPKDQFIYLGKDTDGSR